MSKRRKDDWLVPAIIASGTVAFFLSKSAFGASKPASVSPVQTATVGNRVYSVARLGQGHYIVSLVSTAGEFEPVPVVYSFNQTEELGSNGPAAKVAQLKSDMKSFQVNFAS